MSITKSGFAPSSRIIWHFIKNVILEYDKLSTSPCERPDLRRLSGSTSSCIYHYYPQENSERKKGITFISLQRKASYFLLYEDNGAGQSFMLFGKIWWKQSGSHLVYKIFESFKEREIFPMDMETCLRRIVKYV